MRDLGKGAIAMVLATAVVLASGMASAESWSKAGAWVEGTGSRVRLVAVDAVAGNETAGPVAGIEIVLDDGWKTYWRQPGDSGVPPEIAWEHSGNLKAARVLYPAPHRFRDATGSSIGYKHRVVFPILVEAKDPSRPVSLKVGLMFGVCKDICVPGEAELALDLDGGTDSDASVRPAIEAAFASVPASGAGALVKVEAVAATLSGPSPAIVVDLRYPAGAQETDVFAETETLDYLPLPEKLAAGADGLVRYRIRLPKGADAASFKGKTLVLTAVSDRASAELRHLLQ